MTSLSFQCADKTHPQPGSCRGNANIPPFPACSRNFKTTEGRGRAAPTNVTKALTTGITLNCSLENDTSKREVG